MRKKKVAFSVLILSMVAVSFFLIRTQSLYTSHETLANDIVAELLEHMDGHLPLPNHQIDLHEIRSNPSSEATLYEIEDWELEEVDIRRTASVWESIFDDDPVYRWEADIRVVYANGTQASLSWESWRYGLVLGSIVLVRGNGPPGYVVATSIE
ncbi:MAG: hypothetical protein WAS33_06155 [Candidatus Promineifilaceae bacterium]